MVMNIRNLKVIFFVFLWGISPIFAVTESLELMVAAPSRSDGVPKEHLSNEADAYLEGYIQALVNSHYYEFDVLVYVENGDA